jgi:glycosyltransferase involved in cell wall biosynthesis
MRIAMLAPLYECVPPCHYGGTERVIHYLAEELVRRGHQVTLFATGGSKTAGELVEVCPVALSRTERQTDPLAYHFLQLGLVAERAREFDLIHSHCDFRAFPLTRLLDVPVLSTNHNRLDPPENLALLAAYPDAPITCLSKSHGAQVPLARVLGVCYNGVPVSRFPYSSRPGEYLAFVGRLSPEKGPLKAIEAAEQADVPLRIAAKINPWERDYFEAEIKPRLHPPAVEYVGELGEADKRAFLRDARALLFPICWPEPFGMVLIEAMASGTPVIAFPVGAVPEIVEDGVTGFLCDDVTGMIDRIRVIDRIDRAACRARADRRFSDAAMADAYLKVYTRLVSGDLLVDSLPLSSLELPPLLN